MSHDCSKVSGCLQSRTQYSNTEINNNRSLVGCSSQASSLGEVLSDGRRTPERNPLKEGRCSQTLNRVILGFWYSERIESPPKGVSEAEEPEAVTKPHGGEVRLTWRMCNSGRRPAARQNPPCYHSAGRLFPESGLRHLGRRTLVPFVLGSLGKCYTRVTELNRFLVSGHWGGYT